MNFDDKLPVIRSLRVFLVHIFIFFFKYYIQVNMFVLLDSFNDLL